MVTEEQQAFKKKDAMHAYYLLIGFKSRMRLFGVC